MAEVKTAGERAIALWRTHQSRFPEKGIHDDWWSGILRERDGLLEEVDRLQQEEDKRQELLKADQKVADAMTRLHEARAALTDASRRRDQLYDQAREPARHS